MEREGDPVFRAAKLSNKRPKGYIVTEMGDMGLDADIVYSIITRSPKQAEKVFQHPHKAAHAAFSAK